MDAIRRTFIDTIKEARNQGKTLRIRGHGTRDFLSLRTSGEILDTRAYQGIITYEPEELFITVRSGTPLLEVEETLNRKGQHLCFEPPFWGDGGTIGGMVAAGFAGPRRMRSGPLRDHLLGVQILDGQGRSLNFGGTVIKNVAGYDVARLFAGSWGHLSVLLDVTLKVLPRPPARMTLTMDIEQSEALRWMHQAKVRPWPWDASLFIGSQSGRFWLRLEGGHAAIREALPAIRSTLPMQEVDPQEADLLWDSLKRQRHPAFFPAQTPPSSLWRLALAPATPALPCKGDTVIEWGGALRWWRGENDTLPQDLIREATGSWAAPFDHRYRASWLSTGVSPSEAIRSRLQTGVMSVLDPAGIFSCRTDDCPPLLNADVSREKMDE